MSERMANDIHETLIFDEQEKKIFELIESSRSEILVSTYILEQDGFGSKILEALSLRARAGVHVRIIVDGYGSWPWIKSHIDEWRQKNLDIRVFYPLPWPFSQPRLSMIFRIGLFFKLWLHWNRRCHQKIFMFDGKQAVVGSSNLCDNALEWRETNILIEGSPVDEVKSVFEQVWRLCHDKIHVRMKSRKFYKQFKTTSYIFTNFQFSMRRRNQKILLDKIIDAQKHIRLTTPYFFPTNKILNNLLKKAKSGVEVSIILPKRNDVFISKWIAQGHYSKMLKNDVRIYEYNPTILHAKSMVLDDWAFVGSSNFNRRSFQRDLELDYAISNSETIQKLNDQFLKDIQSSTPIITMPPISIGQKILAYLAIKLAPSWF